MTPDEQPSATAGPTPAIPVQAPLTGTPSRAGRTLVIHGYSASGAELLPWKKALAEIKIDGVSIDVQSIEIGNYISLNNEVTIKDLGEAFDRALRLTKWSAGSKDDVWTFDAIVHSTGMLVLRQWLASDPFPRDDERSRVRRLKHLVGLAPATFGSPQAKKGRSWLGALVKGNRQLGPDFLNAGDRVLDGLELASSYTWDLAHKDLICERPLYGKDPSSPYVAIFIGNEPYTGVAGVSNSPGTDGTVRWAGCALNTRKVTVDLRREPKLRDAKGPTRYGITPWVQDRLAAPIIAVDGQNHGTIVSKPSPEVADLIGHFFFDVRDKTSYDTWEARALAFGAPSLTVMDQASEKDGAGGAGWQQLLIRVADDHGDGVSDYNLQLQIGDDLDTPDAAPNSPIPMIADAYSGDSSYRCFYIRLSDEMLKINQPGGRAKKLWLELIASSGSDLLEYEAYTTVGGPPKRLTMDDTDADTFKMDITELAQGGEQSLLYPYTTTLLEIFIEREPLPLNDVSKIFTFLKNQS